MTTQDGDMCLRKGEPIATTFTPVCTLPAGHAGDCNWSERVALRNKLVAEAQQRHEEAKMPDIERCGFSVERMSRICDKPATHLYYGLGGRQPCCNEHANFLRRQWGIKPRPLSE